MPLYEAQFLIVEENIWFAEVEPYQVIQRHEKEFLRAALLIADDPEAAYMQACAMIDNLSEANFDGPGDITHLFCKGLSELREIGIDAPLGNADSEAQEIDYSRNADDVAAARLKAKVELEVFQIRN